MKASLLVDKKKFEAVDLPVPVPGVHEVLIKVRAVGICGSDVHYWEHGRIGSFVVTKPLILGHEVSGEIVAAGPQVSGLDLEDRVVIEPGVACRRCDRCRAGRYNLCTDMRFFATPPIHGALCEYVTMDSSMVYRIPQWLPDDVATLVEPLAVAVHAVKRCRFQLGERAVVYGAGVIGLCVMTAALEAGAASVTVLDVRKERLAFAAELGAGLTFDPSEGSLPEGGYDVAFECSGAQVSLANAVHHVKPGGRVVQIGLSSEETQEVPVAELTFKEIDIVPVFRYANEFLAALSVLEKRKGQWQRLITHRYSFEEIDVAFNTARYDSTAVKVVVQL